jgi:hypothetical protein
MALRIRWLEVYSGFSRAAVQWEKYGGYCPEIRHMPLVGERAGLFDNGPFEGERLSYKVLIDTMPDEDLPLTMPPVTVCGG